MSKTDYQKTEAYYDSIGKWLDRCLRLFKVIVDRHAKPLALINKDGSTEALLNDFVYYCITKSCKSLQSIMFLINSGFSEDAMILLRSIYENYLSAAYAIQNPRSVRNFIYTRVGLSGGYLEHLVTKKGRADKRKLIDKASGELLDFEMSIGELARGSGNSHDSDIYNAFYPYLCEHVHANMMGSGNYRDDSCLKYSYSETGNLLSARFYTLMVMVLFCEELLLYSKTPDKIKVTARLLSGKGIILLSHGLNRLNFSRAVSIQAALSKRLKFTKT